MSSGNRIRVVVACLGVAALAGCATAPVAAPTSSSAAAPAATPPPGDSAAEKDTAAALEKRFQDAARSYKVVQKDGKTMYCKREKLIGTTIPTLNCLTEAQLRNQVEAMDEYRNRARNTGRCTQGVGCGAGG